MTIGCTRCGASCEGDIILPSLAFGFKHNLGCGHGVGPLAVVKGQVRKPVQKEESKQHEEKTAKEIIVEELTPRVKEVKQESKKHKRFGQKD